MKQYMIIDVDRCWGCKSCTVACKMHFGLPAGCSSAVSVFRIETAGKDGAECDFLPVSCQHCEDPECLKACPKKAIYRNDEGVVLINKELCIKCGKCERVCPYGAISTFVNAEGKKEMSKCDMCAERRRAGGKTSCEQHCPGLVFTCVSEDKVESLVSGRRYHFSVGQVIYVSDVLENLGSQN